MLVVMAIYWLFIKRQAVSERQRRDAQFSQNAVGFLHLRFIRPRWLRGILK